MTDDTPMTVAQERAFSRLLSAAELVLWAEMGAAVAPERNCDLKVGRRMVSREERARVIDAAKYRLAWEANAPPPVVEKPKKGYRGSYRRKVVVGNDEHESISHAAIVMGVKPKTLWMRLKRGEERQRRLEREMVDVLCATTG